MTTSLVCNSYLINSDDFTWAIVDIDMQYQINDAVLITSNNELLQKNNKSIFDLSDTTTGIILPIGTTLQRPQNPVIGTLRLNTFIFGPEVYTSQGWSSIDIDYNILQDAYPTTLSNVGDTTTVTGQGFVPGMVFEFVGATNAAYLAPSWSLVNSSTVTLQRPSTLPIAQEPFSIRVTMPDGPQYELRDIIEVGEAPIFISPPSGSLGTYSSACNIPPITIEAIDQDTNGTIVSISTNTNDILPSGLSLSYTSGNTATLSGITSDLIQGTTIYNFAVSAMDSGSNVASRNYSFTILYTPLAITNAQYPIISTNTSNASFASSYAFTANKVGVVWSLGTASPYATIDANTGILNVTFGQGVTAAGAFIIRASWGLDVVTQSLSYDVGFPLYTFDSFTFTNAGATGRNGPTLAQLQDSYASAAWTANTNYLSLYNSTQGYQLWTVPETTYYLFVVAGATGGSNGIRVGGRGTCVVTKLFLQKGKKLIIISGQRGINGDNTTTSAAGGGGGSFVIDSTNTAYPLIAASGGGGAGNNAITGFPRYVEQFIYGDQPTITTNTATSAAGANGATEATAGAGYLVDSGSASSFTNGFLGGSLGAKEGGFGGGGAGSFDNVTNRSGGGGGGWIGGRTANNSGGHAGMCFCTTNEAGVISCNYGNGFVYIRKCLNTAGMTNMTFTSLGKYNTIGPTFAEQYAAYTNSFQKLYIDSVFPSLYQAGFQSWVVPQTGTYRIEVTGANGEKSSGALGGKGAILSSTFSLEYGDLLMIIVGQCRSLTNTASTGAGGGATWVVKLNSSNVRMNPSYTSVPLIGAGGGGGAYSTTNGKDASDTPLTYPTGEGVTLAYNSGAAFMANNFRSTGWLGHDGSVVVAFSSQGPFGGGGRQNTAAGGGGAGWINGVESTTGGNGGRSYCLNSTYTFDPAVLNSRADQNGAVYIELL